MDIHVAAFAWREDVADSEVEEALRIVKSLEDVVEGVQSIHVGPTTSKWSKNLTHVVVVIGDSSEAIDAYRKHPIHVDIASKIDAMELDGIGLDLHDV